MGKKYIGRVSEMVRQKLAQVILEESNDPRLAEITITGVEVNRDTTRAQVYYSLIGDAEKKAEAQRMLDGAAGWLRGQIAPTLRLRNIPELVFVYDPSLEHGERIDALLEQWHREAPAEEGVEEEVDEEVDEDANA